MHRLVDPGRKMGHESSSPLHSRVLCKLIKGHEVIVSEEFVISTQHNVMQVV